MSTGTFSSTVARTLRPPSLSLVWEFVLVTYVIPTQNRMTHQILSMCQRLKKSQSDLTPCCATWRLNSCAWKTSTHRWCNTSTSLLVSGCRSDCSRSMCGSSRYRDSSGNRTKTRLSCSRIWSHTRWVSTGSVRTRDKIGMSTRSARIGISLSV